ncbi:hypothetical protein [Clostridium sp. UBA1652]|uniref:hypothetical protein n=1 Tax=Clostridium sp. UBA1652 TaxID=1946348 RepID=UPI00257DFAE6|nr:hypothetical protein [Clostridium sp. UBA1652]
MNPIEYSIRKKYRYTALNYVFDVYMECEYRANLTQEIFEELEPGEFRFDYESWSARLGISKKQLERAIKELTTKSEVIMQTEKGKRGTCSKYFLARFQEKKKEKSKEGNKRTLGEELSVDNSKLIVTLGEEKGSDKERKKEKKKEQSSQYNNLNIESNNIYMSVFDYWNEKNIKRHRVLNNDIKKAIDKALKIKVEDEFIKEADIKSAIDNYKEVLDSDYFFNYKWGLAEFLTRKQKDSSANQLVLFLDNGATYENYKRQCKKPLDKPQEQVIYKTKVNNEKV